MSEPKTFMVRLTEEERDMAASDLDSAAFIISRRFENLQTFSKHLEALARKLREAEEERTGE